MDGSVPTKPHAVLVSFPTSGHINPLLDLGKLLHSRGFHITYVLNDYVHHCMLKSNTLPPLRQDGFHFEIVADGLPLSGRKGMQYIQDLNVAMATTFVSNLRQRLLELRRNGSVPPYTCLVGALFFDVLSVAEELGFPGFLFWTTSACGFTGTLHTGELIRRGYVPLKDESYSTNGHMDIIIDWIPGIKPLPLKHISSFYTTTNPNDTFLKFDRDATDWARRASGVILNTFDDLEHDAIEAMRPKFKKLYTVGPLTSLADKTRDINSSLKALRLDVWPNDSECLTWLNGQQPGSVVFVNFGSIANMKREQLVEFAWGIAGTKCSFLWIVRPDLVIGESSPLPSEFLEETKSRGFITSWCPQEEVLSHSAVGGFLTHCGWNSMLESLRRGVPILVCWPTFADQLINAKYACEEWGVGLEIEGEVRREKVEGLVRELMSGMKGKVMKENAVKWKDKAREATCSGGSSSMDMDALVLELVG